MSQRTNECAAVFSPEAIQAASLWSELTIVSELGNCENLVLEADQRGTARVLRITRPNRRPVAQLEAELLWLCHLDDHGVSVARPIESRTGNLFETIPTEAGPVFATLFERAAGSRPKAEPSPGVWDPKILHAWGRELGKLHAVASAGVPSVIADHRPHWENDQLIASRVDHLRLPLMDGFLDDYEVVLERIRQWPVDRRGFGLVHVDLHLFNIFYEPQSDGITMFDFEECNFWYFIYDLAPPVWHETMMRDDSQSAAEAFLEHFIPGYLSEYDLPREWFEMLPDCFRVTNFLMTTWAIKQGIADDRPFFQRLIRDWKQGCPLARIDATKFL